MTDENEISVYLIGDIGNYNNHTHNIFNTINKNSKDGDSVVLLGDNFYPSGVSSEHDNRWNNFKKLKCKLPIFPILGNHDYGENPYAQIRHRSKNYKWNFPYFYYKVNILDYDLFFIDTCILQPNYSNLTEDILKSRVFQYENEKRDMMKWLEFELEKSRNKKIVLGHYPIISLGIYGVNQDLLPLIKLFEKYDVSIYVSGHDHNLQINTIENKESSYVLKHLVSGSGSGIYQYLSFPQENNSKNIFFKNGFIKLEIRKGKKLIIKIQDEYGSDIYTESV